MKAGQFNINDYLEKLNEGMEENAGNLPDQEGMVIPEENKKSYQWLKKEYQKAQTEVKVEIHQGGDNFDAKSDMQGDPNAQKDFKPGMFGEVKTADTGGKPGEGVEKADGNKPEGKENLDGNKDNPEFGKEEGEKPAASTKPAPATDEKPAGGNPPAKPAASKPEADESDEDDDSDDKEKEEKPEVKKIDLKTKKQ